MPTVEWPRAIFFDAGNTLLRINYAAIVAELTALGVSVTARALQRAEWRARVRLDAELFAGRRVSTESGRPRCAISSSSSRASASRTGQRYGP